MIYIGIITLQIGDIKMGVKVKEKDKGSGIWYIFIDHKGTRKARKIGRDKRKANQVAKDVEQRLAAGDLGLLDSQTEKVPTLKEYVYGWTDNDGKHQGWIDTVAKLSIKASTSRGYKLSLKNHIIPVFGSKRLNEINSREISGFIYKMFNDGFRSQTVKNAKHCLSGILRHAYKNDQYITSNPAIGVSVPTPPTEEPSRIPNPLTWDERDHFEKVWNEDFGEYYPLIICGFRTGLRISELISLQWDDIDFHNGHIIASRTATRGKITTKPKTDSSSRIVRMTHQLINVLKIHLTASKKVCLKNGWKDLPQWVFYNQDGGMLNYDNFLNRVWNKAVLKSGLSRRTPHDMRHTYATLRLSKGDSLAEVSKEMGHRSPEITYKTYYKWLPEVSSSNINELDGGTYSTQKSATYPQPDKKEGVVQIG
jgi:integrase